MASGYCPCPCRDCMEVAIADIDGNPQLCILCDDAGCSADGDCECRVDLENDDLIIVMSDDEPINNN